MTFLVNLLPQEIALRKAARRTRRLTVSAVVLVVVVLCGLYVAKLGQVSEAEAARAAVQADVTRLQAEVASLQEFRELHNVHQARNTLLASAMEKEISFSRVLSDIALSFPSTSSLRSLHLTVVQTEPGAEATGASIALGEAVASLTYEGYSTDEFSPGIQDVLVELEKVGSFFDPYLGTAAEEEIGTTEVTGFQGTVQLDDDAYTRRYADGLPGGVAR